MLAIGCNFFHKSKLHKKHDVLVALMSSVKKKLLLEVSHTTIFISSRRVFTNPQQNYFYLHSQMVQFVKQ